MKFPTIFMFFILPCLVRFPVNGEQIFNVSLNGDNSISLHWIVDYLQKSLSFEIHLPTVGFGWFAFGFSDRGRAFPADYCLVWKQAKKLKLMDTWAGDDGVLQLDHHQDCLNFRYKIFKTVTKFTFKRQFDTCDNRDYIIEDGTTHLVWARGWETVSVSPKGLNISIENPKNVGMIRVNLLKNLHPTQLPNHVEKLDLLNDKVQVPTTETTYWCKVFKLPHTFQQKHHIYQYEANIENQGLVHHMELFHCEAPIDTSIPLYNGNCFGQDRPKSTEICKRVLAAWAMGAQPFTYPKEAALPLGGPEFNPYIMLEVHYNNPELLKDVVDSSGIRFYVSTKLRAMDAGVIELGLEYSDKMAIPPGQVDFTLTGYCISSCTSTGLNRDGITVFGSQLHTHLTGTKVYTRHFNAYGKEMPELDRDNHYSTHFQEIRLLKRPTTVLPGDILMTICHFNTMNRKNVTLGGFAISDEMCVNYIHYYPHVPLEVCKSSISDQALSTYFTYMKEWEDQHIIMSNNGVSDNFKSIQWNKMRVQLLNEVYHEAPLSMQCNMSSGDRFPGYWENAPLPAILLPLAPPTRGCSND